MSDEHLARGNLALQQDKPKVIVINPVEKFQRLRVAPYVRVSSDSDEQEESFGAQMRYYTTLVGDNNSWDLVDIYADEAVTGTLVEKRSDFKRLLADCRRGLIDKVITKSIARFARNTAECLESIRELKALGIGVFFETENIDTAHMSGEMMAAILAATAQNESETISKNTRWGYRHRMSRGIQAPVMTPYGYRLIKGTLEIAKEEAVVVRQIFDEYLAGMSSLNIALKLEKEKVPCIRNGNVWRANTVRYILKNEKYIGDTLWQKTYTSDTLPFKTCPNRGEKDQYYVEDTHPAIIDKDKFDAVQALMKRRAEKIKTEASPENLNFQGKLICGNCGRVFRRKMLQTEVSWACRTHVVDKEACPVGSVLETEIEAAFLRLFFRLKHQGQAALNQLLSNLHTIQDRQMLWSVELVELNNKICEITSQNHMLTKLKQLDNSVDPDFFISQSNDLAEQLRATKLEKERLLAAKGDETVPKTVELLEALEVAPEALDHFDKGWFDELVDAVLVDSSEQIRFRLKNGLELSEPMERAVR